MQSSDPKTCLVFNLEHSCYVLLYIKCFECCEGEIAATVFLNYLKQAPID